MAKPHSQPNAGKKNTAKEFSDLLLEYPIVGCVNMQDLPASQLQTLREKLRDTAVLKMTKRRIMKVAMEKAKAKRPGLDALIPHLKGMPALIFTKENPFSLFKTIKKNKSPAPARAGQTAPKNIVVPAGPTQFLPGPIIGELGMFGIKSKVDAGKIAILQDTVVAKEGTVINQKLAELLTRLNIQPMEIGLDLVALFEEGKIIPKSVLDVDETQYARDVTQCAQWAFNLAMESAYPAHETRELLVQKAFKEAKLLALESKYPAKEVVADLLALAHNQCAALQQHVK